jgi:Non-ribosomal peptide synthetase modules and related proteins
MTMVQTRQVEEWPATPIQGWMREHDTDNPNSGYYVLPFTWSIAGQVDWQCFAAAFEAVCMRHPVLRAALRRGVDSWLQTVRSYSEVPVRFRDVAGLSGEPLDKLLQDSYDEYCRKPFRLTEEPPIRVLVLQLAEEGLVLGAFHQAACDIESMAVFISEFSLLYEAYLNGTEPDLPGPGLAFGEYASRVWPTRRSQEVKNLAFWREKLAGVDLRCCLPVDFPDAVAAPVGPAEYVKIGAQPTARAVHTLALQTRCSEHSILLAALTMMLANRSGQSSFVLSCPVTLRRSAELLRTFGPMTDLMWLRLDVAESTSLVENSRVVFRGILEALAHPCPVDVVARQVGTGTPYGPLTGPNLQCQNFPAERVANPEWVTSSVKVNQVMPVYLLTGPVDTPFWLDLTIAGERVQPDTDYSLVYRSDLFRPETARAMAGEIEATILGEALHG